MRHRPLDRGVPGASVFEPCHEALGSTVQPEGGGAQFGGQRIEGPGHQRGDARVGGLSTLEMTEPVQRRPDGHGDPVPFRPQLCGLYLERSHAVIMH